MHAFEAAAKNEPGYANQKRRKRKIEDGGED